MKRIARIALSTVGVLALVAAVVGGGYCWRNVTYHDRLVQAIEKAGYAEQRFNSRGVSLNVGVSPARSAIPIVLLHGQASAWQQYGYALVDLAERNQVFAVDIPGHGKSGRMDAPYRAAEVAEVIADYIATIGRPVVLSGHSSGGQLAAIIAARHPDLVKSVLLEDPPFFTTELPRAKQTWNWVDLASTTHRFIESGDSDWQAFQWRDQKMWEFFGDSAQGIIDDGLTYHADHPGQPIKIFYLPPAMNEMQVYILDYDPQFGDAFYTGEWNEGFDQYRTLQDISAPVTYVHCKEVIGDDGILQAAAGNAEAAKVMEALGENARLVEADSGHNYHVEKRKEFVAELLDLTES